MKLTNSFIKTRENAVMKTLTGTMCTENDTQSYSNECFNLLSSDHKTSARPGITNRRNDKMKLLTRTLQIYQ